MSVKELRSSKQVEVIVRRHRYMYDEVRSSEEVFRRMFFRHRDMYYEVRSSKQVHGGQCLYNRKLLQ